MYPRTNIRSHDISGNPKEGKPWQEMPRCVPRVQDYLTIKTKHLHALCLVLAATEHNGKFPLSGPMSVIPASLIVLIVRALALLLFPCPWAVSRRLATKFLARNPTILSRISTAAQKQTLIHIRPDQCRRKKYPLSGRPSTVWTPRWLI